MASSTGASVMTEVGRARATGVKRRRRLERNFMAAAWDASEGLLNEGLAGLSLST